MKTVLLCVAESDTHVVANKMIEQMLSENNVNVINLGPCTSLQEMAVAYGELEKVDLIAIGSLNGHAINDLKGLSLIKKRYKISVPVVVGGNLSVGVENKSSAKKILMEQGVDAIMEHPLEILNYLNKIDNNDWEVKSA